MFLLARIVHYCDRLEDHIRARLSRYPIAYAFVGGIGIVLFWRGVWHTTDMLSATLFDSKHETSAFELVDGPVSFVISIALLLSTGLFVSSFIGSRIIVSGLKGEKKISEKTEAEIRAEETEIQRIERELKKIQAEIAEIETHVHPK